MDNAIAAIATHGAEQKTAIAIKDGGRSKTLQVETFSVMVEFTAVGDRTLHAARADAKVLIIRNNVGVCVQTQQALEKITCAQEKRTTDTCLLFRCDGGPDHPPRQVHHGGPRPLGRNSERTDRQRAICQS